MGVDRGIGMVDAMTAIKLAAWTACLLGFGVLLLICGLIGLAVRAIRTGGFES